MTSIHYFQILIKQTAHKGLIEGALWQDRDFHKVEEINVTKSLYMLRHEVIDIDSFKVF